MSSSTTNMKKIYIITAVIVLASAYGIYTTYTMNQRIQKLETYIATLEKIDDKTRLDGFTLKVYSSAQTINQYLSQPQ